jgi:hypothetical protein
LLQELQNYSGEAVLVRGLPGESKLPAGPSNLRIHNHLPANELNQALSQSAFVIGRSGYSSIMDLVMLEKKGILIPTPGQPEQEYLANYLFSKKIIFTSSQGAFSLKDCLKSAKQFPFLFVSNREGLLLKESVEELLGAIQSRRG